MEKTEFIRRVVTNPINNQLLQRLPLFELKDCWLVSGALFQTVWNSLTGREPDYGIVDYDVIYYDPSDLSWEAENETIQRLLARFKDLPARVEIRNQARVHLWYEDKFGLPYGALNSAPQSIDRYLAVASMVGISANQWGDNQLYAPHGLDDIQSLRLRPNPSPNFCQRAYEQKTSRWKSLWPEVSLSTYPD